MQTSKKSTNRPGEDVPEKRNAISEWAVKGTRGLHPIPPGTKILLPNSIEQDPEAHEERDIETDKALK